MRRIPYIRIHDNTIEYLCPKCLRVISRDMYKYMDDCPSCGHSINKYAKTICKVYDLFDKDMLNFIYKYR